MIYFYKHKSVSDYTPEEIDLLGYGGILKFANQNGADPSEIYAKVKMIEHAVGKLHSLGQTEPNETQKKFIAENFERCIDEYISFFNGHAAHDKQAYVVLGNISSGKSRYAKNLEKNANSMIIDSDRFKMGEANEKGEYAGFSPLYKVPTDREVLQEVCSDASKIAIDRASSEGYNLVLPKASTSLQKLERQLEILQKRGYDIHLIQIECPLDTCANRSYYRFLVKQYAKVYGLDEKGTLAQSGRFVPVEVVKKHHDGSYVTFYEAFKAKRYSSYKAYYNDDTMPKTPQGGGSPIDLETMQPLF